MFGSSDDPAGANLSGRGSRWWSIDLHAHSPGSFDFGGLEDRPSEAPQPSFVEWLQAFVDAGLDGVVVADHNSHAGIDKAREALQTLREQGGDIVVFPGVEITAHGGTHVLAVFDPSVDSEVVNRVLTLAGFKGTRGRSDETAAKTVLEIARIVQENEGICIPAHADMSRGVFGIDVRDLDALSQSGLIRAVEVVGDNNLNQAKRFQWTAVLGSDAHHLTTENCPADREAKAPGTHFTWMKAETLDLEGFRLALTDCEESIRRARMGSEDPNRVHHTRIESVEVTHQGATEKYLLSPWMTCFIGGRGVGKSTLLELIRLCLGRSDELPSGVREELTRYSPLAGESERWWGEDSKIVVHYSSDSQRLRVTWLGRTPATSCLEAWNGKAWIQQVGSISDRAPVRVFSQKQVFELATSPQNFLKILDQATAIFKADWSDSYEALRRQFRTKREKLHEHQLEAQKVKRIEGQVEELEARLAKLSTLETTSEYRDLLQLEEWIKSTKASEAIADAVHEQLSKAASELRELSSTAIGPEGYSPRRDSYSAAADLVDQALRELVNASSEWEDSGQEKKWVAKVHELTRWVASQFGGEQRTSEQITKDRARLAELTEELALAKKADNEVALIEAELDELLRDIREKRHELFQLRSAYARSLNSDDSMTKVSVFEQAQTSGIEPFLRRVLNRPEAFDSAFSAEGLARELYRANPYDRRYLGKIDQFKTALLEFLEHGRSSALGQGLKADNRFFTHVSSLDAFNAATQVMLWFPEDLLDVRYRPREGAAFEPVDRGSPGQRTAALLAVILRMGTEPLLLDQPEDDLENKLIRSLVVESLKQIKNHRQVIVATHNANIVVTSGAENILVLEHGLLPKVPKQGTLQTASVREDVCLILEGGADAIRSRYQRLIDPT